MSEKLVMSENESYITSRNFKKSQLMVIWLSVSLEKCSPPQFFPIVGKKITEFGLQQIWE